MVCSCVIASEEICVYIFCVNKVLEMMSLCVCVWHMYMCGRYDNNVIMRLGRIIEVLL